MNLRISVTAAVAVLLASLSLNAVLQGNGWLAAGIGAVIVIAGAGIATRLSNLPAALAAAAVVLIGVVPLFFAPTWPVRATGLVIVALTAASATGWRVLRAFAVVACYLAALLIYLNLVFANAASFARIIPSYQSVAVLGRMVPQAFDQFRFSPPVPDTRPVSLVTAAGIGLIAIIVDIVAVRLRRPAVAGVPLLVLFSVPVASNLKTFGVLQSVTFGAALAGFLALLSADGRVRLRMWGRLVTFRYVQPADEAGAGPDTRELAASGRRIGLAAVCLAVIIPIILPAVHARDVFGTTDNGKPRGVGGGLDAFLGVQHDLTEHPTAGAVVHHRRRRCRPAVLPGLLAELQHRAKRLVPLVPARRRRVAAHPRPGAAVQCAGAAGDHPGPYGDHHCAHGARPGRPDRLPAGAVRPRTS